LAGDTTTADTALLRFEWLREMSTEAVSTRPGSPTCTPPRELPFGRRRRRRIEIVAKPQGAYSPERRRGFGRGRSDFARRQHG